MKLPLAHELPCYPCPHQSICCNWGVTLIGDEAETVRRIHGAHTVTWDAEEQEFRTAVVDDKHCIFLKNNACSLHASPEYPAICRGFPWSDGEHGDYIWDRTICPELSESHNHPLAKSLGE
jgi:hypothetical protein